MIIHNAWKCILRSNEHWLERKPLRFKNGVPSAQTDIKSRLRSENRHDLHASELRNPTTAFPSSNLSPGLGAK